MRRFFLFFSIAFFIGFSLLIGGTAMLASGDTLSKTFSMLPGSFGSSERFEGRVAGDFSVAAQPVLSEQRGSTSEFRPIKKDGVGTFAVPTAHAAIILDAGTETVLFESSADERRSIASITKLFTSMIVVETINNLDEPVTITEESIYDAEGTRVGCPRSGYCISERLHVGEKISVRSLLKAALMNSANDAAIALAVHVDGSQERFAERMNARAKELGMDNSHFCTSSGLELDGREEQCYSSARDIAKVAAEALRYDILWDIMRTGKTTIASVDGAYVHEIFNTNQLLGQYPNLMGTKTGFTPRSGYSLLAVAEDPADRKHRLIAVVLDDAYRWNSIQDMFAWGFGSFEWR